MKRYIVASTWVIGVVTGLWAAGADHPFKSYDPDNIFYSNVFTYHNIERRSDTSHLCREAYNNTVIILREPGSWLAFQARENANSILIRYGLPFPTDRTITRTLNVYVNGVKKGSFTLSAWYMHNMPYTDNSWTPCPPTEDPTKVQRWWDEAWLQGIPISRGDIITIQKDADNQSPEYYIDLVDLEMVAATARKPDDTWVSITDYGAVPDDETDDRQAILNACAAAAAGNKKVWIPAGRFLTAQNTTMPVGYSGITISGAGMWHTEIYMHKDVSDDTAANHVFNIQGGSITIKNMRITKKCNFRRISQGFGTRINGGNVIAVQNTAHYFTLDSCWILRSAVWNFGAKYVEITNNRLRCSYIDGIHLDAPASFCTVDNNHIRFTGDDFLAQLLYNDTTVEESNRFSRNTCEISYMGRTSIYFGGKKT